jgi:hypothetical protein
MLSAVRKYFLHALRYIEIRPHAILFLLPRGFGSLRLDYWAEVLRVPKATMAGSSVGEWTTFRSRVESMNGYWTR